MKKFKEKLLSLWERILRSLTLTNIVWFILIVLAALALAAGVIWLFGKLLNFILLNFHVLLICGTIIGCFCYWIYARQTARKEREEQQKREQVTIDEERERKSLESTYSLLKQVMYLVLNDTSHVTKLPRINSISALESPTHFVKANGFHTFMYLVAKEDTTVNISYLQDIINTRLEQGLRTHEFDGISQSVYLHTSGRTYPIICINKILDLGSFLQLDVCLAGKAFAEYKERSLAVDAPSKVGTYDIDF